MDNIVHNFANITFQPKEVGLSENRSGSSSSFSWSLKPMATAMSDVEEMQDTGSKESEASESSDQSDEVDSQLSRGEDDDSDWHSGTTRRGGVARRRMPARVSKDNFNRVCRAIMKPIKKNRRKELTTNSQTLKSIEKIYTNKRIKKFTPTNLETIFEEPSDENAADVEDDSEECSISSQVRIVKFGNRKLRRAISFSDGLNKNKILLKKRRQKVKKTFGKRFALKKISMTEFHDRLNKSFDSAMLEGDAGAGPGGRNAEAKTAMTMDDIQLHTLSQYHMHQPQQQPQPAAFD
ncbi:protein tantalus [Drosophila miranda]|uniref:protein tantalus n=1 Tax=Drosophila miranda TaxID=7229 RepID=UPI0007E612EC|nr:protein tantalus [Drosophila miranda]XP_033243544.1 protein tantalus [Drosophila miranda]